MMRPVKRVIALLLSVLLVLCGLPFASAQNFGGGLDPLYLEPVDIADKLIDVLVDKAKESAGEWAMDAAKWGAKLLIDELFPGLLPDEQQDMKKLLGQISDKLDVMENMLTHISESISSEQLAAIINGFLSATYSQTPSEVLAALASVDESSDPAEKKAADRLVYLTNALGIPDADIGTVNAQIDNYTDQVFRLMTMSYAVTLDGRQLYIDMLGVLQQWMMRRYKWENSAYEEWKSMELSAMSYVSALVLLDELSVLARVQKCEAAGLPTAQFKARLDTLNGYAKKLEELRKDPVKKLDDRYRHYWWQDKTHIYFYTEPDAASVPRENKNGGIDKRPNGLNGINVWYNGSFNVHEPKFSFWQPFIRYHGGNELLISLDQLRQIYQDYNGERSLWEIFFSQSEGNFTVPSGVSEGCRFIIDQDKEHPITYYDYLFKGDELYCWYAQDPGRSSSPLKQLKDGSKLVLCVYHSQYTEPKSPSNNVGIGVYRVLGTELKPEENVLFLREPPATGESPALFAAAAALLLSGAAIALVLLTRRRRRT